MKKLAVGVCILFLVLGCEKSITFRLDPPAFQLVVEATIENGQPPVVILTKSLDFFSEINPQILLNSFVHNAEVTISEGTKIHKLIERSYKLPGGIELFYYSVDSANPASLFTGQLNTRYLLNIRSEGKEYTASTTIPALAKKLDSLWWKRSPGNPDSTKVIVMTRVTDPPGYGNYIRYFTKTNNGLFLPGLNSVFDDQIIDGSTYDIEVEQGIDRNAKIDFENYSFFTRGDSVTVKFCNIDKETFDFWRTMEFSYASIGNPFSSPTRVAGNIKGGALGYFGGYAVQYKSLVIPR